MVEISQDLGDSGWEVERKYPLKMSEEYYDRGLERMRDGKILDGLVDLHLAKDHLVGKFAPYGIRQSRSLEKTLAELDPAIEKARAELRQSGPLRIGGDTENVSRADVKGRNRLH
jgi:hypothetical protein